MTQTKTLFVAFSHTLTVAQVEDARQSLGVDRIIMLSEADPQLQRQFSQVDPRATTKEIQDLARRVIDCALAVCGDEPEDVSRFHCILAAGEPTLAFWIAHIAHFDHTFRVVQSTTERQSVEAVQSDGSIIKTAIFQHVQWRSMF